MSRTCARPGCSRTAAATLSYAYSDSTVVLEPLAAEAHPMVHDLCSGHAAAVRVPLGWQLDDQWTDERSTAAGGAARDHLDLIGA